MVPTLHSAKLAFFTLQSTRLHSALSCGYNASNGLVTTGCAAQRRKQLAAYYRQASSASLTRQTLLDNVGTTQTIYGKETSPRSIFSTRKQLAAEAEWLQEEDMDVAVVGTQTLGSVKRPRFDWRQRAPSRIRSQLGDAASPVPFVRRTRPVGLPAAKQSPELTHAIDSYSTRFRSLIALEELEDEAALNERLARWPREKLEREGFCLSGMSAYWLKANQFGRPVASFILGPGIELPVHKFEGGMQVLLSRSDPLAETPIRGSILSHTETYIRICFSERIPGLDEGAWRLDLGRPNLVYERMRSAISSLQLDTQELEAIKPTDSSRQLILEGTHLKDILLAGFYPSSGSDCITDAESPSPPLHLTSFENMGAFKDDMRIVSWALRYSRKNPIVLDGDPPLDHLNASQKQALAAMVGQRLSLIQGPPGTGKTKTIIEAVKLLKLHFEVPQPVLICTYTNVAVDNLVEGLGKAGVKPLRVGFNGNVRQALVEYSLDYKLQKHPLHPTLLKITAEENKASKQREDLMVKSRELADKLSQQSKPRKSTLERARKMKEAADGLLYRCRSLKSKIFATQQQMLRDVVADADVICTTCVTSACAALNVIDFPVVFLDEASMSTEPASLIPITKGSKHVALIGDHKQLPPVIVSKKAQADGLAMSLFERLTEERRVPSVMLDIQYRMHPDISHFPASEFYNLSLMNGTVNDSGEVIAGLHPPYSKYLEPHLETGATGSVVFLDHNGNESLKGRSYINVAEAHIVASIVEDLLLNNDHLQGQDIGIIAPYVGQIGYLTRLLKQDRRLKDRFRAILGDGRAMQVEHIEIKTVDGFEGREKEVIIFSTVRNNSSGNIGFLADRRRLNVGLTRAKRGLFVIGSIQTLEACKKSGIAIEDGLGNAAGSKQPNTDAEVWRRYTEFLKSRNRVVVLTGNDLSKAVYGHLYQDAEAKRAGMEEAAQIFLHQAG